MHASPPLRLEVDLPIALHDNEHLREQVTATLMTAYGDATVVTFSRAPSGIVIVHDAASIPPRHHAEATDIVQQVVGQLGLPLE